jgi:photosystem II stability/assembly factor-like uncharacterized protein
MRTRRFWSISVFVVFLVGFARAEPDVIPLGPFGGDVRSLSVHPARSDRVFLGTADGQIYVSEDWGLTWARLSPGLGRRQLVIDGLAFDPRDPDVLWAGGWELKSDRGGLYRTRDGGGSWERFDLGIYGSTIRAVAVAPADPNVVAVGINEGVLLSRDGGRSWERISRGYRSLHQVHSLAFDPFDAELLYVGTWRLGWRTPDLGNTWVAIHNGMFWDSDIFSMQVDRNQSSVVFAGACSGIYKSTDGGDKWLRLRNGLPDEARRTRAVRIDPHDSEVVYAGTTEGLYRSVNGGESWDLLLPGVVINALVIHPLDGRRILLGTDDAGVLSSVDRGATFSSSNEGFIQRQIAAVASRSMDREEYFVAVAKDGAHGGFFLSANGGRAWSAHNEGLSDVIAGIRTILPSQRSRSVYLGTVRGIYRGVPGGEPWERLPGTERLYVNGLQFLDEDESRLLVAAREGVFRADSARGRPTRLTIPVYDREVFSAFVDRATGKIYIGTEMGVFRSDDGGDGWQIKVKGLPFVPVNDVRRVGSRLFAATRNGLFLSGDEGESWFRGDGVFPIDIVAVESGGDGGHVLAADPLVGYLFSSDDEGSTWEAFLLSQDLSRISALSRTASGKILAGTLSEGVVEIVPRSGPHRGTAGVPAPVLE